MKLYITLAFSFVVTAQSFAPPSSVTVRKASALSNLADEYGIPCDEECALESYPNLPKSVHPGVLSGQAMMDLLNHAKENGKKRRFISFLHRLIDPSKHFTSRE